MAVLLVFAVSDSALTAISAVGAFAIAAAGFVFVYGRRAIDRQRSRWRTRDQLQGWTDDRDRWHPGVVDIVFGWEDDQGVQHPSVPSQIEDIQAWCSRHEHGPAT